MADGEAVTKVGDSRSVSSPSDDCSSPLGESPHKLISDCSDLYDLINFHSSATTQIHQDDDSAEELQHDEAESPSKTNGSAEPSEIIHLKRNRSISVSSSSSSASGTDHESDSGHFSKTNGHAEPEIESAQVSVPDNEELLQVSEAEELKSSEEVNNHRMEHEEGDEELDEFQNLEAEIEQEVERVQVDSVVEPEVHDNPIPNECVLTQSESSLAEEEPALVIHEEPVLEIHEEPVLVIHEEAAAEVNNEQQDVDEPALENLQQHETVKDIPVIIETNDEKDSSGSSSEDEEEKDEEIVNANEAEKISHVESVILPPVIVDVEISQEQRLVDHNNEPVDYIETDKLDESFEQIVTEDAIEPEQDVKLHVDSSISSDSDSDHGGKYGYQKKKKVDQFEKTSTTTSSSSAVVTTVVTKKKTAEMKFERGTSSPITAVPLENANVKSYRELELAEMESALTGVNINDLKASFSEHRGGDEKKSKDVIDTGVNIRSLKSSFNSTETEMRYKEFNEAEGVKIDRNKITRNFSQTNVGDDKTLICRICGKQVFLMESIKAEKSVFHKTCFRCHTCSKSLSVDTYCSHEGTLYCRQHFRQLFQPKAKFDEDVIVIPRRRHELIIKENIPAELPPDVVRSADKPDYGLNEIPSLKNVKSRFEEHGENGTDSSPTVVHIKRSESIASKMARFQSKEFENGNGHGDVDDSSSSEDEGVERDPDITREIKHKREMPLESSSIEIMTEEEVVFSGMSELKNQWEAGSSPNKEERAREKQEELAKLRSRICHGRGNLKAKYESACEESLKSPGRIENVSVVDGEMQHTNSLKEKFERGQVANELESERVERLLREKEDDLSVFKEQGTAVDARNIFKQIDANVSKTGGLPLTSNNSIKRSPSSVTRDILNDSKSNGDIVKSSDKIEDDYYVSFDLTSRFKFFENYKAEQNGTGEKKRFTMTPPREILKEDTPERDVVRDPNIVRSCDKDEEVIVTDTARKMLNRFRELESHTEEAPAGPKPLKRITPPREFTKETDSPEPEMARDPNIIRACDKLEDDFLVEAHRAKSLREKFEHWEGESDVDRENRKNLEEEKPGVDMAKSLAAKFELLRDESSRLVEKPQAKVNRFI